VKVLYLLTARGGSKGVPGKNIRKVGGKSLIEWKVSAARPLMRDGDQMVMSTDSTEIAAEAMKYGVSVPFVRPAELATDTASSASVIRHALDKLPGFDAVMLLEPSAPFATTDHLRQALTIYEAQDADLVVGMKETDPNTAFIGEIRDDLSINPIILSMRRHGSHLRRQDLKPEWSMAGSLYLFRTAMFLETGQYLRRR